MSNPIPVSRSQLLDIRTCPRMAALRYRLKLNPSAPTAGLVSPSASIDLVYGTLVHYALELIIQDLINAGTPRPIHEIHSLSLAHPDWAAALERGFYGVETSRIPDLQEMVSSLLYGHIYIALTQVIPTYQMEMRFTHAERELQPLPLRGDYGREFLLQGRADAIAITEDEIFEPTHIVHSFKTAATWGPYNALTYLHDDQGMSESLLYFRETGIWPAVQMTYFLKGYANRDGGTITFTSPFTTAYCKHYKDGTIRWSPSYTTGWEKRPTWEYPGGLPLYIEEVLSLPEHAAALAKTWARPPLTTRSQAAAEDWLLGATHDFSEHYEVEVEPLLSLYGGPDQAMKSFPAWPQNTVKYGRVCPYHAACQLGQPLSTLGLVPRTPHHPAPSEEES